MRSTKRRAVNTVFGCSVVYCLYLFLYTSVIRDGSVGDPRILRIFPTKELPLRLVEFAYMRGGSSVVGEIFNNMNSTIYWYEPLDTFYTSYAALDHWSIPYDITHTSAGIGRKMAADESEATAQFIYDMLRCRLDQLPVELVAQRGQSGLPTSLPFGEIGRCLKQKKPSTGTLGYACTRNQKVLKTFCGVKNSAFVKNNCTSWVRRFEDNDEDANLYANLTGEQMNAFRQRETCRRSFQHKLYNCTRAATSKCDSFALRSAKILRTRMSTMEDLLRIDPNVLILHTVRDPRAIMVSRRKVGLLSRSLNRNITAEGLALCRQMVEDLEERSRLQITYPGSFLHFQYEHLVNNLNATLTELLDFLQLKDSQIYDKMYKLMHADSARRQSGFSHKKSNATAVSTAWRKSISHTLKRVMDNDTYCQQLYTQMGYVI